MKKFLSLLLALTLCSLLLCGCAEADMPEETYYAPQSRAWSAFIEELNPRVGFLSDHAGEQYNTEIKNLSAHSFEDFSLSFFSRGSLHILMSGKPSQQLFYLEEFNESYPVEYLKLINENILYVVYKLQSDDGEQCYAYVMFVRQISTTEDQKTEQWWKRGEIYFVSDFISASDLDTIKIGDTLQDVVDIDPGAQFDLKFRRSTRRGHISSLISIRLLSDGILWMEFALPATDSDYSGYILIKKQFYSFDSTFQEDDDMVSKYVCSPSIAGEMVKGTTP